RIALRQQEQMWSELSEYAHGLKGHLRIMSNTASLTEFLPDALANFLEIYPNINIDLEERLSYEIVFALLEGAADVGILADTVDTSGLDSFPFHSDHLMLVTSKEHPLSTKEAVYFAEALDYDFIGLEEGSALQAHLAE